jgi:hypothetical protein
VHAFINDLRRSAGTDVYGRRMYETMAGWQTDTTLAAQSEVMRDFAHIWQVAEKIVYVAGLRTRVPLHPPGPKPQRVSTFLQCSRQLDRQQLRLPVVPRANPA